MVDWKEAEQFFLEAGLETYAGGREPEDIPELPGSKVFRYHRGAYRYLDCYFTSPVGVSFGWTFIYHDMLLRPIWWMRYDGWYDRSDPRITKFLRTPLSAAYTNCQFIGGRGPSVFTSQDFDGLVYYNHVAEDGFARFSGRDKIVVDVRIARAEERERYWHEYRGGILRMLIAV